jgi:hypothetical protein
MAVARPMLGDVELQQVQKVEVDENQVLAQQSIPALEGDFLQRLGRGATRFSLTGVLSGLQVADSLKSLREKFRAAEPVAFVADIATATQVTQVLIEEMDVRELAGKPERFEYAFTLCEYISPPAKEETKTTQPVDDQAQAQAADLNSQQVEDITNGEGTLEVQVELPTGEDYTGIVVSVQGKTTDGQDVSTWSSQQTNGIYSFPHLQAGTYTVSVELQ